MHKQFKLHNCQSLCRRLLLGKHTRVLTAPAVKLINMDRSIYAVIYIKYMLLSDRLQGQPYLNAGNGETPAPHYGTNAALSALQNAIDGFNTKIQFLPTTQAPQLPDLDELKQAGQLPSLYAYTLRNMRLLLYNANSHVCLVQWPNWRHKQLLGLPGQQMLHRRHSPSSPALCKADCRYAALVR